MIKFLVVDDSKFMRNYIKNFLFKKGYAVIGEADSGKSAIMEYKKLKPDIVIMDMILADMEGIEIVQKIKEFDYKAIIIMCSSIGQKEYITEALKNGAIGYVIKPISENLLIESIENAIRIMKYASKEIKKGK